MRAVRIPVADEPLLDDRSYDYADAFAVDVGRPDERTAEWWARAGLEGAPAALRAVIVVAQRDLLRMRLRRQLPSEQVLGWRIVSSTEDAIVLEASGSVLLGVIVGRRTAPGVAVIQSFVYFRRRLLARCLWTVVGPIHRRVARYLLERAAAMSAYDRA